MVVRCPHCDAPNDPEWEKCSNCKARIPLQLRKRAMGPKKKQQDRGAGYRSSDVVHRDTRNQAVKRTSADSIAKRTNASNLRRELVPQDGHISPYSNPDRYAPPTADTNTRAEGGRQYVDQDRYRQSVGQGAAPAPGMQPAYNDPAAWQQQQGALHAPSPEHTRDVMGSAGHSNPSANINAHPEGDVRGRYVSSVAPPPPRQHQVDSWQSNQFHGVPSEEQTRQALNSAGASDPMAALAPSPSPRARSMPAPPPGRKTEPARQNQNWSQSGSSPGYQAAPPQPQQAQTRHPSPAGRNAPDQYSQRGAPDQYSQRGAPDQYSQRGAPEQYSQRGAPEQYSQRGAPEQYSQRGAPEQYSQQGAPEPKPPAPEPRFESSYNEAPPPRAPKNRTVPAPPPPSPARQTPPPSDIGPALSGEAPISSAPKAKSKSKGAFLVFLKNGREERLPIRTGTTIIGRSEGDIMMQQDPQASPWHAQLTVSKNNVVIKDMYSRNGIYRKIARQALLQDGDRILIGKQRLVFRQGWKTPEPDEQGTQAIGGNTPRIAGRVMVMTNADEIADLRLIREALVIGRSGSDLSIPEDESLEDKHAQIQFDGKHYLLIDLNSPSGVFLNIRKEAELNHGDTIMIGAQLLRIER